MNIPTKQDKFAQVRVGDVLRSYVDMRNSAVVVSKVGDTHIGLRYTTPRQNQDRVLTFGRRAFNTSQWMPREAAKEATT